MLADAKTRDMGKQQRFRTIKTSISGLLVAVQVTVCIMVYNANYF